MKIAQEVHEFAAEQNAHNYLWATAPSENIEEVKEEMSRRHNDRGDLYLPPKK